MSAERTVPWCFAGVVLPGLGWPENAELGSCHLGQRSLLVFPSAEALTPLWVAVSLPQAAASASVLRPCTGAWACAGPQPSCPCLWSQLRCHPAPPPRTDPCPQPPCCFGDDVMFAAGVQLPGLQFDAVPLTAERRASAGRRAGSGQQCCLLSPGLRRPCPSSTSVSSSATERPEVTNWPV